MSKPEVVIDQSIVDAMLKAGITNEQIVATIHNLIIHAQQEPMESEVAIDTFTIQITTECPDPIY